MSDVDEKGPGPLRAYQVMATIVGLNLLVVMAGFLGKILTEEGSWWHRHQDTFLVIDQVHGFLFMVLLVLIAILASRNRWTPPFTITTILLACVPFVSFWAERRTTRAVEAPLRTAAG
ncbi:DUF3817 domain-containing protein [Aeromicrobium alkaliterrae]|uniref:DUF3817 domain-containing protein n=1 Tax=Aeromicrobium alkaliterrae TaxID=302168 RepID=A0ABP4VFY8_9ACTN